MTTVLFLGPSLKRAEARAAAPGATILGPARQGDVFHAIRDRGATVIGLVDGAFLDVPAIWHREILWALERGVHVFGAASMGALRAAELDRFGMVGIGVIYDAYRSGVLPGWQGVFEDDDEVAVVHAPAELGHAPLSDAMVDLRLTLSRAADAGILSASQRDTLADRMKALHFPERTLVRLKEAAIEAGCSPLMQWLDVSHTSQKRLDALLMLQAIDRKHQPGPREFAMQQALTWVNFVEGARRLTAAETEAARRLREDAVDWPRLKREALGRLDSLRTHPSVPDGKRALAAFCAARGLETRADMVAWAVANDLDEPSLVRLASEEACLDAATGTAPPPALAGAVVDLVRLAGRYGPPAGPDA